MRIGIISDTHGFVDPALPERLAGVECILHGGDIDSQDVLDELGEIAPVHAVRGNVDPAALVLPFMRKIRLEGVQVEMKHILPVEPSALERWSNAAPKDPTNSKRCADFLKKIDAASRVILFGHSHEPCLLVLGGALFFNPGSAGKKRFSLPRSYGLLEIEDQEIRAAIYSLDEPRRDLPGPVRLPLANGEKPRR